jgi:hypothetical protein
MRMSLAVVHGSVHGNKADIQASSGNVRFWGVKRTLRFQDVMSA